MKKLTESMIKLLAEIEENAQKVFDILGEKEMKDIINNVVALRQRTAVNEGALTHVNIPKGLELAKRNSIAPEKICELSKLEKYAELTQAAECIINFRRFYSQWMNMIIDQQIYEK